MQTHGYVEWQISFSLILKNSAASAYLYNRQSITTVIMTIIYSCVASFESHKISTFYNHQRALVGCLGDGVPGPCSKVYGKPMWQHLNTIAYNSSLSIELYLEIYTL